MTEQREMFPRLVRGPRTAAAAGVVLLICAGVFISKVRGVSESVNDYFDRVRATPPNATAQSAAPTSMKKVSQQAPASAPPAEEPKGPSGWDRSWNQHIKPEDVSCTARVSEAGGKLVVLLSVRPGDIHVPSTRFQIMSNNKLTQGEVPGTTVTLDPFANPAIGKFELVYPRENPQEQVVACGPNPTVLQTM